ncbi:glycosyltransferase family 4 protein [Candidatus Clostridium stratigraminis]|uniref:Glycosyltransferase family 4 protein n=1 Tax=Candidatus Clostridium stratigraminis TaxID=3381661 RepID=A0ABW8T5Y1_9CLOT
MKILHCCLSCFYIDNYNYQENVLPSINKMDGHKVKIIASTETFIENSQIGYTKPEKYYTKDGIEVERIAYKTYLPHFIMKKIRHYENVYKIIEEFSPDVILFHGAAAYELITVAKYKKNNPHVKFYVDSHEDKNNSGRNWISKNILHGIFYKNVIKKIYKYIDKIFYITYETKIFSQEIYDIKEDKLEYFPLGGFVLDEEERMKTRNEIRQLIGLSDKDILLVHSGKLDRFKRTRELLEAFLKADKENLKLVIIGSIAESVKNNIEELIKKNNRILYIGWKDQNELTKYLCACDLYVQPGSQSATMQNALCCGSAVAVYPYDSHLFLLKDTAFYMRNIPDMVNLFSEISRNRKILDNKRELSFRLACEKLDYRRLGKRLYK